MNLSNRTIWLFPGQGSQNLAMLENVDPHYFQLVKAETGKDFQEQPPDFQQTVDIQLALLITEVSTAERLREAMVDINMVAGHSLGAFSAAVVAQVLTLSDAIKLVYRRASLMQSLYPTGYGMGVITGLTQRELATLVDTNFSRDDPVYLSNQNEELQLTISGSWAGIDRVIAAAKEQGAGLAKRIAVPTPSHSILMKPVAEALEQLATGIEFHPPTVPYLGNCTGRLLNDADEIAEDLIHNVVHPVKWLDMMQIAVENGMHHFIELPPGRALTNLVKRSYPDLSTYSVAQYGISDTLFLYKKRSSEV